MIPILTHVQPVVITKSRRDIVRGRVWAVTQEQTPRYSVLPDGEQSLTGLILDMPADSLQLLEPVERIRLVKV